MYLVGYDTFTKVKELEGGDKTPEVKESGLGGSRCVDSEMLGTRPM